MPVHAVGPSAGGRKEERADRRGRVEESQHPGAAEVLGDCREEGERHPEEHRHHVDHVGADQLLAAPRVAQAFDHAAEAWSHCVDRRRHGAHHAQGGKSDQEGADVQQVGDGEAERGDQDSAQCRAEDLAEGAADAPQGGGRSQLIRVDEPRQHCVERGTL